jgi:energy-coupling factor transport system substrate-specific component
MTSTTERPTTRTRWRTVDIVVGAVLAVAFGVVFQGWSLHWNAIDPRSKLTFAPIAGLLVGMWLIAGVTAMLIIRKPGAALFVETVAAVVSALLGSQWGVSTIVYGIVQGLAVELVFLAVRYRWFGLGPALLAGGLAGVAAAVLDFLYYYGAWSLGWKAAYLLIVALSGVVIAGGLAWLLVRALARTGVLTPFAAGREQRAT